MRRGVVVTIAVLAAALAAVLLLGPGRGGAPPLATTADGLRQVRGAVYGRSIEFDVTGEVFRPWSWGDRGSASFPVDRLCIHVRGPFATPTFESSCGCSFVPDMTAGGGGDDRVFAALSFPRRDRTLRMRFGPGDGAVAEFPNPFPAPPPASKEGIDELPVTTRLGDETWVLSLPADGSPRLVVRAVDADRNGFEWTYKSAAISDASGNRVPRATDGRRAREHRIVVPLGEGPFSLCPHEPWWEFEVVLDAARAGQTVRWRFVPPR